MKLEFNVKGDERKRMVKALEEALDEKALYLKTPSCAYQVGNFKVGKNGELEFDENLNEEEKNKAIKAAVKATGVSPKELEQLTKQETNSANTQNISLSVALPKDKINTTNLAALLESKASLIKKALGVNDLSFKEEGENIIFDWFDEITNQEEALIYTRFISSLCKMSVDYKRISNKPIDTDNEKFSFRTFLIRLGYVGNDYKQDRKFLLRNLTGSSAFRYGAK